MKKETIKTAPTVEAAVSAACEELGVKPEDVIYEVLTQPKRGFLGIGSVDAKVRVEYTVKPSSSADDFAKKLLENMQIDAEIETKLCDNGEYLININGEEAGVLIGHHGETLDALQYLCNLAANKKDGEAEDREYTRVVVDISGYRAKREETLRQLARRTAERALKYKRSVSLEPMPSHERRIIHSEVQRIDGVTTNSVGSENNRRVVVFPEKK
ncbi:MAG: protein jag [Clostridia bacterium]|nr:protein jag [Clostridia bacterium]